MEISMRDQSFVTRGMVRTSVTGTECSSAPIRRNEATMSTRECGKTTSEKAKGRVSIILANYTSGSGRQVSAMA